MELIIPDYTLLVMIVIFLLTFFVVKRYLVDPINGVLDWRASKVHEADSKFEDAMATLHDSTKESEEKMQQVRREAAEIRDRYRSEATGVRDEKMTVARNDAGQMISEADEKLAAEVTTTRANLAGDAEALANEMAERILGRKLGS